MIKIDKKEDCCGCSACYNVCPKNCISMQEDYEGFLYPVVNEPICSHCGLCNQVCPIINVQVETPFDQKGYVVQHKDKTILKESTSGGAFTAIAQVILAEGGVVFGAAFDENFVVRHTFVEKASDLTRFRNSKYVQSDIGNSYTDAEKFLNQGRIVCFSGTPCQIEGLKRFLRKDYENLITVDVMCRAVPSPKVLRTYLKRHHEKLNFSKVFFRDKSCYGYKYSQLLLKNSADQIVYHQGIDSDQYLRAFFSSICIRPSCYECHFRKRYRVGDLTIWDFFEVGKLCPQFNNNQGATRCLSHTTKGTLIIKKASAFANICNHAPEQLIELYDIGKNLNRHFKRDLFFVALNSAPDFVLDTFFSNSIAVRFESFARRLAERLGFYMLLRRTYKLIMRREKKR